LQDMGLQLGMSFDADLITSNPLRKNAEPEQ